MQPDSTPPPGPREILVTPRLALRATVAADIAPLHERVFADAQVIRFAFSGRQLSREETDRFVRERFNFAGADIGFSTLVERGSGEVIGFSGLSPCHALGRAELELGFVLAKAAWGKGYATEIGRAQVEFAFGHLRRSMLLGLADPANTPSIRVLLKLGMHPCADVVLQGRGPRQVYCLEA